MNRIEEAKKEYKAAERKKLMLILVFVVLVAITVPITLGFGVYKISLVDSIITFIQHITGNITNPKADTFIWNVRLPRALGAITIGAGLSVAGAVMQNDFKNPLAEPYTMGISSGAFFGVVIVIVSGACIIPGLTGQSAYMVNAFVFSIIPIVLILLVAKFRKVTPVAMILIGIAVMFLFNSISQVMLLASTAENLADAYSWRVGNTSRIGWSELPLLIAVTVVAICLVWTLSRKLDVMYAGDRGAQSLGIRPNRLRIASMTIVSLMTAAIVSVSGTIGFIGLVGPHIARMFVGSNNKYLIPASAAFGALFIAVTDTIAKVTGPDGLPVGVISSLVGGPLFVYILIKCRSKVWM